MTTNDALTGPAARYFDDVAVGERFVTQGRTMTETEVSLWAMFTGDMNPMHVDEEFARTHGLFGGRFPPGLAAVALASGLKERLGLFAGTGLAMRSQTIVYRSPVLIGDTIHVELTVRELVRHQSRDGGTITFTYEIRKQDGAVAVEGEWAMLVATRPA